MRKTKCILWLTLTKKINDLEELKKSVLQKAFSGELRGGEPVEPKTEKIVI